MSRGSGTALQDPTGILYGDTPTRLIGEHSFLLEPGVTGFYNKDRRLYKIRVDQGAQYRFHYPLKDLKTGKSKVQKTTIQDPCTIYTDRWGRPHREDGPAMEYASGTECWWVGGRRHREDGPAVTNAENGFKAWHYQGQYHREDGPSMEWSNGDRAWHLHGTQYNTEEEMLAALANSSAPLLK